VEIRRITVGKTPCQPVKLGIVVHVFKPSYMEIKVEGSQPEAHLKQKCKTLCETEQKKRVGGVSQVIECLFSVQEALGSTPKTTI
jgi:hypothetical protein